MKSFKRIFMAMRVTMKYDEARSSILFWIFRGLINNASGFIVVLSFLFEVFQMDGFT